MLAAIALLGPAFAAAAGVPAPAWTGPVDVGAVTASVKWSVHAAPDGRGGAVCAWEENRGRKVCCRDTRDVYAQRLDAGGRRVWDDRDVPVAVEDPGEEVLGLLPGHDGGALACFRRGNGSLFARLLDGAGAAAPDRPLDAAVGAGEWLPGNGFAVAGDGRSAAVLYGVPAEGGMAVRLVVVTRSAAGWTVAGPVELGRAMGLHPGALAWCADRWLAVTWSETADGLRVAGIWVRPDSLERSAPVDLGFERGRTYAFLRAEGDGAGGAWVLRAAVDAAAYGRTHDVTLTSVARGPRDAIRVRHMKAGSARTSAMFIPPVMVGAADQPASAATPPTVAWRPTSWVVPAGSNAAWVLLGEGGRLVAALVRRSGGALAPGRPVVMADGLADAFVPAVWSRTRGGCGIVWGRTGSLGIRLETATLAVRAGGVTASGSAVVALARSPRVGAVVPGPDERMTLVYAEVLGSESGAIRAVPLPADAK